MSTFPPNTKTATQKFDRAPRFGRIDADMSQVDMAVARSCDFILGQQHADGYWSGELEADSMLEADYIFLHVLLESGDPGKMKRALTEILRYQKSDGSWSIYPGGPGNISLAVKCYFACKLMGMGPNDPILVNAPAPGSSPMAALLNATPSPRFTSARSASMTTTPCPPFRLRSSSHPTGSTSTSTKSHPGRAPSSCRLSIIYAKKPFKQNCSRAGNRRALRRWPWKTPTSACAWIARTSDQLAATSSSSPTAPSTSFEAVYIRPLRKLALRKAEQWMLERLEMSDGLGAIYPAMLNAIVALRCLGYSDDDPHRSSAPATNSKSSASKTPTAPEFPEPTFRMLPCLSPVWDTAYAMFALGEAGVSSSDPRMLRAADWILSKEVRHKGDWAVKVRNAEPGGWYFEFNNEFYPDTDDTAQVLLALSKVENPRERYQHEVSMRAIEWLFAMQCKSGGWASFDKDNTKMIFQYIPFADHNAMLDPPTVDITGRMLEMLAGYGYTREDKRVEKAIQFILSEQQPDGSWFGRWGVNYLYGTFLVLRGLEAMGMWNHEPEIQQAAEWIRMVQNSDGGWGESCMSYDDPNTRGIGPSTPSQTAWAIMGLLAAGDDRSDSVAKGVRWLLERQQSDGAWDESVGQGATRQAIYTGTGFPRVFYLAYHMYRNYFPLLALTTYKRAMERAA